MKENYKMSNQAFFRALVTRATEAIAVIDRADRLLYANSACSALLGYAGMEQELLGLPWTDFRLAGEQDTPSATLFSRAVDAGWQGELRLQPRNGQEFWAAVAAYPLPGEDKVALMIHDITARQQKLIEYARVKKSLRREQELLDALMNYLPDWIFFKDADSRIIRSSRTHAEVLGLADPQAAIGKTDFDFFPPEDARKFFEEEQALMHSGQPVIGRVGPTPTQEGDISWRSETKIPMRDEKGQVTGLVGISRDVTSLKLAEEELRQRQGQLEELVAARTAELQAEVTERTRLEQQARESLARRARQVQLSAEVAQEIIALTDLQELLQRVVVLVKERFGYYHAQIFRHVAGRDAMLVMVGYGAAGEKMAAAGHTLPYGKGVVGTAAATGEPVLAADVRADPHWVPHPELPATQGELAVPIKWRAEILGVLDVQSATAGALTAEDQLLLQGLAGQIASSIASARLLAETQRSQQRYRNLYNQSPDCYFSLGPAGTFVDINATGLRLLGYERAELVDKMRLPQLLIPTDRAVFQRNFPKIKHEGRLSNVEVTFQRRDGSTFPALVDATAIYDEEGNFKHTQTIVRDITEIQAAQLERKQVLAETQVLYRVSRSLITQEDLQIMLRTVIEGVVEALAADRALIIIFELETRRVLYYLKAGPGSNALDTTVPFEELWEGLSGWVLRERQPALSHKGIPDPRESSLVQERRRRSGSGSIIVVPLLYQGELLGTLTTVRRLSDPDFVEREVDLLATFAQQVAATVVNRRLLAQAQARAQREQLLREISTRVRSSIDVEAVMRTAVRELGNALDRPAFVRLGSAAELTRDSSEVTASEITLPEGGK
ncbi:MAG TPA: PAS domain S-box protein [Thermoflexia bacterium]|nr:PAS domain S-box protein [Thermoflexia bacterium]